MAVTDASSEHTAVFCSRPAEVVDMRRHLVEFFSAAMGRSHSLAQTLCHHDDGTCGWLATSPRTAPLYWVAPDMCRLLDAVAPSLPAVHPDPLEERGLVVFATPLTRAGGTQSGADVDSAAIYWDTTSRRGGRDSIRRSRDRGVC
jgi:hypothetical protein